MSSMDANAARLTARERRALLEDIGHVALTLGRFLLPPTGGPGTALSEDAPASSPLHASPAACSRPDALTSPQERLHFLCALWANLEGALTAIVRQPDSRAACVPQSVPLARSRGGAGAAASISRSPQAAAAWRQTQLANKHIPFHSPMQTPFPAAFEAPPSTAHVQPDQTPVVERGMTRLYDTWANRLTVSLLRHIEEEAKTLSQLAHFCDAQQESAEAERLVKMARRTRTGTFLRDCPGLRDREAAQEMTGDNIGRCSPPYRAVYRAWRSLHHPLDFDWSGSPLLYLPALEPWYLYEIWCYLQVAAALMRAGWHLTHSDLLRCTPNGLRLGLATGRASRLCFIRKRKEEPQSKIQTPELKSSERLFLYYQPLFASANQTAQRTMQTGIKQGKAADGGEKEDGVESGKKDRKYVDAEFAFVSRSHAMQPDIVLHWNGGLALLDSKFKRYAEAEDAQDDINKMHTYRDAITRRSHSGAASMTRGAPPVSAAWCLFPGMGAANPEKVEAEAITHNPLYAYPTATPETPFGTAGVGAFWLRPGQPDTAERLADFLTALLTGE